MKLSDIHDNKLREKILRADQEQNPHRRQVGGLETSQPKPAAARALVSPDAKRKSGKAGVEFIITLLSHRKRLLDEDNHIGSLKPLRDGIAKTLGIDDGSLAVRWQYQQIKTEARRCCCNSGKIMLTFAAIIFLVSASFALIILAVFLLKKI